MFDKCVKYGECKKVVEHVVLFQMKEDFNDEQEEDMFDHLFTL
jgi:hypothetical protein